MENGSAKEDTKKLFSKNMSCGESCKESWSSTYFAPPRKIPRIGTWNVITMHELGNTDKVLGEMKWDKQNGEDTQLTKAGVNGYVLNGIRN